MDCACAGTLGLDRGEQGDTATAVARSEDGLMVARELEDDIRICIVTNTLAESLGMQGDTVLPRPCWKRICRTCQLARIDLIGITLNHLGHVAQIDGAYELAMRLHMESLSVFGRRERSVM